MIINLAWVCLLYIYISFDRGVDVNANYIQLECRILPTRLISSPYRVYVLSSYIHTYVDMYTCAMAMYTYHCRVRPYGHMEGLGSTLGGDGGGMRTVHVI